MEYTREQLECAGAYTITCTANGRVYVGITTRTFQQRWREHRKSLSHGFHRNRFLQSDWNTYGAGAFVFSIREVIDIRSLPNPREYEIGLIDEVNASAQVYNVRRTINPPPPTRMSIAGITQADIAEYMTAAELAGALRVHRKVVSEMIKSGVISYALEFNLEGRKPLRYIRRSEAQPLIERTRTKRAASSEVPSQPAALN